MGQFALGCRAVTLWQPKKPIAISENSCIFTADFKVKSRSVMPRLAVENLILTPPHDKRTAQEQEGAAARRGRHARRHGGRRSVKRPPHRCGMPKQPCNAPRTRARSICSRAMLPAPVRGRFTAVQSPPHLCAAILQPCNATPHLCAVKMQK